MITAQDIINRKDEWFSEGSYIGEPWSFVGGSIDEVALASLITAALQAPWVSVTEQLPPEDPMSGMNYHSIPVLIFWRESEPMICAGVYAFKRKRWFTIPDDEDDSHHVTHWMPRPDPPK